MPELTTQVAASLRPGHEHIVSVSSTKLSSGEKSQGPDGIERRLEVPYDDPLPYRWICKIKIFKEIKGEKVYPQKVLYDVHKKAAGSEKVAGNPIVPPEELKGKSYVAGQTTVAYGTGFLINIPQSRRCIVLTAAHNLSFKVSGKPFGLDKDKEYIVPVARVILTFPGDRAPIEITNKHTFYPSQFGRADFGETERINYDYGIIVLPGEKLPGQDCGFGYSATMTDRQLLSGISLGIFGYPALNTKFMAKSDEPWLDDGKKLNPRDDRILYGSGGSVQSVGPRSIRYFVNTSGGQSGSPVYIWDNGIWTVVGIHARYNTLGEKTINSATRVRVGMLRNIFTWLHDYDVGAPVTPTFEAGKRQLKDYWYPLWHVTLSSQGPLLGLAGRPTDVDKPRFLQVTREAKKDFTDQAPVEFKTLAADTPRSVFGIIPVKTFSEGHNLPLPDNLWVIASLNFEDTFLSFDSNLPFGERISATSRYRHTPILRRALELVTLKMKKKSTSDGSSDNAATHEWEIIPVRCPGAVMYDTSGADGITRQQYDKTFDGFTFTKVQITKVGDNEKPRPVIVKNACQDPSFMQSGMCWGFEFPEQVAAKEALNPVETSVDTRDASTNEAG